MKKLLLITLLLTIPLTAQITMHGGDFTAGTLKVPSSATLPGSCTGSGLYQDTSKPSGQQLYSCVGGVYVLQGGGSGDVAGPASATDSQVPVFNGTTGKVIKVSTCSIVGGKITCPGGVVTNDGTNEAEITGSELIANGSNTGSIYWDPSMTANWCFIWPKNALGASGGQVMQFTAVSQALDARTCYEIQWSVLNGTGNPVLSTSPTITTPTFSGAITFSGTPYVDIPEITTPSNPAANSARFYARDAAGATKLYYRDSAGVETDMSGGSSTSAHYKEWLFQRNDSVQGTTSLISALLQTASSVISGNYRRARAAFDGTTSEWAVLEWTIPNDWTGTLDFYWMWSYPVSATAGDKVRFLFDFACISPADDTSLVTPASIVDKSVSKTITNIGYRDANMESHLAVDISATCAANDRMVLRFGRVPAHADDNQVDDVWVPGLNMKYETTP